MELFDDCLRVFARICGPRSVGCHVSGQAIDQSGRPTMRPDCRKEGRSYSPEEAQIIRDAYLIAARSFERRLSTTERHRLAQTIIDLAAHGCLESQRLATRAVIRIL
jgi:hypothetical protein